MRTDEFPPGAGEWPEELSRRDFLRRAAASAALAGLSACTRQPLEKIVPYVRAPEEAAVPGESLYFATALVLGGFARGMLVESRMGRPVKVEGNPLHPASLGATDVFMQASILDLYDPGRSQVVLHDGEAGTWAGFDAALRARAARGRGRILTERVTSPTLLSQIHQLRESAGWQWHQYDPLDEATLHGGAPAAVQAPDLSEADTIVSLDADLFGEGAANLALTRAWARRRRVWETDRPLKLYVAEPSYTITGAMADYRLPLRASGMEELALQLVAAVRGEDRGGPEWVRRAAADLRQTRGVVIAGDRQPDSVRSLAAELNPGRQGGFVPEAAAGFAELCEAMRAGEVETLLILGGDPVTRAPADFEFAEALQRVPFSAFLGLYENRTAARCRWHLPQAHFLETWSDARCFTGQATILQPLIEPLFGGRSAHEVLAAASMEQQGRSGHDLVRSFWSGLPEEAWEEALAKGLVGGPPGVAAGPGEKRAVPMEAQAAPEMEVNFRADPCLYDGQFARNAWLQELPAPVTKQCWGNAVLMSPETAKSLGVAPDDVVELSRRGRSIRGPVLLQPGHAGGSVTVHLGHGEPSGFDAYPLRTSDCFWFGGVSIRRTGARHPAVVTQNHQRMEGRDLVRHASLAAYRKNPGIIRERGEAPAADESFYPSPSPLLQGQQWGMVINLSTCVGCNACVVACQAENNIPVVGPQQVAMGREMHWIRIDTYFAGEGGAPGVHFQPVPCMHCEKAPCELVCPVAATVHDSEGLNVQVYNRCVGTRYCSNNCPYKVRRFNFLEYNGKISPSQKLGKNPQVTVRSRGVMEKCTYCVQRIQAARIAAKKDFRRVRDEDVVPACAQACPAEAITFGDVSDPGSRVSRLKQLPLNYGLLEELNTRPRTTYLAKITLA